MIAVEHELTLRVSPERVWAVLTDFAGYAAWHPSLRLGGDLEVGKTFDFGYVNARTGWETGAADAVITRLEPAEVLEWRVGIRFLFSFTESCTLDPVPGGTRLVHRVEYGGLAIALAPKRFAAKWHTRVRNADVALQRYLEAPKAPARTDKAALRRARPKRRTR
jgi:hypothetical protein